MTKPTNDFWSWVKQMMPGMESRASFVTSADHYYLAGYWCAYHNPHHNIDAANATELNTQMWKMGYEDALGDMS